MSEQQHLRIISLVNDLRMAAAPVGPMHSNWDVISDMQAFIQGKPTIVNKTADEWIKYAEELLTHNES